MYYFYYYTTVLVFIFIVNKRAEIVLMQLSITGFIITM